MEFVSYTFINSIALLFPSGLTVTLYVILHDFPDFLLDYSCLQLFDDNIIRPGILGLAICYMYIHTDIDGDMLDRVTPSENRTIYRVTINLTFCAML